MSRSTTAVLPGSNGHNDDRYEDDYEELTAAQKAEHASIRAGINARLAALKAEANARRSASANVGPRLTKKQKQTASLAKRQATLAAKAKAAAAAAAAEEEEEDDEDEEEEGPVKAEGGAGSGPAAAAVRYAASGLPAAPAAAAVPMSAANYVAAAAARYAASGLPAVKKGTVRFLNMANARNVNRRDSKVPIGNRSTRKSTAGKPVVPAVNIRRSRHAANISALFAKMSSFTVDKDPGYLTKVLSYMKTKPNYLDTSSRLTDKEKELLKEPGTLAQLERKAAMTDKE